MILAELAREAGVPDGVLSVVHGAHDTVNAILDAPEVKAISFVGADTAGTYVHQSGTHNGKRVQSNMAAKNHCVRYNSSFGRLRLMYVRSSCRMPTNRTRCTLLSEPSRAQQVRGAWLCPSVSTTPFIILFAGELTVQTVITVGKAREMLPELIERAKALRIGNGFDPETEVSVPSQRQPNPPKRDADRSSGPVISVAAKSRVESLIATAVPEGGELLLDGREAVVQDYPDGNFVAPTVIRATTDMSVYK